MRRGPDAHKAIMSPEAVAAGTKAVRYIGDRLDEVDVIDKASGDRYRMRRGEVVSLPAAMAEALVATEPNKYEEA